MTNNLQVSYGIIENLLSYGITEFVISPGSRSTPLTIAAARLPEANTHVHFDERGAAFFALGLGKATRIPAVLICTSGTAVANYFPAVVEASMDNVPLVILSADRPPELIDVGANQAIFQENIYGRYTRLSENLLPPDETFHKGMISGLIKCLVEASLFGRPGPVQLNCQFREPLIPTDSSLKVTPTLLEKRSIQTPPASQVPREDLEHITHKLSQARQGLLIVGRSVYPEHEGPILELATRLQWPVLPDIQSNLRFRDHPNVIHHFDLNLINPSVKDLAPDMVIHFGGPFTSKRLLTFLRGAPDFYISVKETPERIDPNHQVDQMLLMSPAEFCESMGSGVSPASGAWLKGWQDVEERTNQQLKDFFTSDQNLTEPRIAYELSKLLPANHTLMLGNSMAIRSMEMFGLTREIHESTVANRGSSGIDGLLATAVGFLTGRQAPLTLLLGDLALLHDLNSLALTKTAPQPLLIILINNQGGGIFNFLPVREETDIFETYFGTPHSYNFEKAAEMFDLAYSQPRSLDEFKETYLKFAQLGRSVLVEIMTDRSENHALHQRIFDALKGS